MALVIVRKQGQSFYIGDEIKVTLEETGNTTKVRIRKPFSNECVSAEVREHIQLAPSCFMCILTEAVQTRIAINAPKSLTILREEICKADDIEKKERIVNQI